MNAQDDPAALTRSVAAVPGVTGVYAPVHAVARVSAGVTAAVTRSPAAASGVRVKRTREGTEIAVCIGVDRAASARAITAEVAAVLLAAAPGATVRIEVSRIT